MGKFRFGGVTKPLLFLLLTTTIMLAATAQVNAVGVGASPAVVNLGVIGRGGTATSEFRIYNTDNKTQLNYTVAVSNVSDTVSVTPSSGTLQPKTNTTVKVNANVANDAKDGSYKGLLIVNSTASGRSGQVVILPALAVKVNYTVNGTAPATPPATINIPTVPVLAAGIILVIAACVVVIKKGILVR